MHLHDFQLGLRERTGLGQDLVRYAHLAEVVEVRADEQRRLLLVFQSQDPRHRDRVLRHALAVPKRGAVARFERLPPLAHHREERRFELRHLAAHVHEVDARVETPEQPVRRVQQPQRFLIAPHPLIQQRQLV